ncbi:putative ribonuclease H-like domain-containing protein [Tanacetum coccineum]
MELENAQNNALAKLPMLKLREYEMWEIRIKQYFQIQDYALWEVIENGNSLQKLVSRLAILGVVTPPEDLNVKFLRSLPFNGHTHCMRAESSIRELEGVIIDGSSDMAEEEIQANMALMAFSDSEYDDLLVKLDDTGFKASTYKRGLSILEGQILKYKESEVLFSEEIALLKRSVGHKEYLMGLLRTELEKVKEEKEGFEFKIAKFEKSAKDLDQLLASQITDKTKKGFGYNDVPSPHPLILNRPTPLDLSYSGLEEFKQPEVNEYGPRDSSLKPTTGCDKESDNSKENTDDSLKQQQKTDSKTSSVKSSLKVDKDWKEKFFCLANQVKEEEPKNAIENNDAPIIEDWVSDDEDDVDPIPKVEKKTIIPTATKKYCPKTSHPSAHKHMAPRAVLMKTGLKYVNTVRSVNTGRPFSIVSGCSRHMTGNIAHLSDFKDFDGGYVTFGGGAYGGRITGKGKQHRASCKTKAFNPITKPLFMLHMDLFGPTFVSSLMHKKYCLVVTDDYSRFSWVFFLSTKDETTEILKNFIKEVENLVDKKVKIIRSDNGTEFKNKVMDDFCREKGIKREYSVARTPQQNGVAERKNRTLIEAARTMLADSKLPTTFWAEAVSTACYVQNRVLIVKPHNKTPYELFRGFKPAIGFMKPFGCHVTILNTLDKLGKFDGKSDEGFFVGYSLSSKAFRVYNTRTRKVQENLHIGFLENKPMIEGNGPKWLFDLDSLTQSMNYVPVVAGTFSNDFAGKQGVSESSTSSQQDQDCIVMPIWKDASYFGDDAPRSVADAQIQDKDRLQDENDATEKSHEDSSLKDNGTADQQVNTASPEVNTGSRDVSTAVPEVNTATPEDLVGPSHASEDTQVEFQGIELGNIPQSYAVPTTPHTRIHKDHPINHVIGDVKSSVQTRRMTTSYSELGFLSAIYEGKTHQDLHTCLFACFLSQEEPKRVSKALSDPAWVEAMQEELLQFKLQKVWILVDLPKGHRAIGTKWVYRNKKDERGIVIRNKARLVAQGHTQEEGIDYDEVFAPVARIEAIRMFLAYASYMGFMVMGLQSTKWLSQMTSFLDLPRRSFVDEFEKLMKDKFHISSMGELTFFLGLQVQQRKKGIFISQDKYIHEILRKFNYTDVKSASTPTDLEKPLVKDAYADDVDEHLYRSIIRSLMYLTTSRPDIMFALIAYTDSDYAGATLDRKSTTGVATSTTEAEYVAAASCCGQVLWIQNQLLDYGYNFMNTVIYIDNTSTICIIENHVQHSKTKHIEIRHHFIRDCNTKKLIQMAKIDTQLNVADLLTKGFDAGRFQYLVSSIGMLNP